MEANFPVENIEIAFLSRIAAAEPVFSDLGKLIAFLGGGWMIPVRSPTLNDMIKSLVDELKSINSMFLPILGSGTERVGLDVTSLQEATELAVLLCNKIEDAADNILLRQQDRVYPSPRATSTTSTNDDSMSESEIIKDVMKFVAWLGPKLKALLSNSSEPAAVARTKIPAAGVANENGELLELLLQAAASSPADIGNKPRRHRNKRVIKLQGLTDELLRMAIKLAEGKDGVGLMRRVDNGDNWLVEVSDSVDPIRLTNEFRDAVGKAELLEPTEKPAVDGPRHHQIDRFKVVCIIKPVKMSKMSLAKQLYMQSEKQFQCRAFVSVSSRSPKTTTKILTTILAHVTGLPDEDGTMSTVSNQYLINKIYNFLGNRRYIVIFDDISEEEWRIIQQCLPKNTLGSRIIITVHESISGSLHCGDSEAFVFEIMVRQASDNRYGSDENNPFYDIFEKHHSDIPFTLICISSPFTEDRYILVGPRRVEDEQYFQRSFLNSWAESLSLCYKDLPLHMRTFLLYCTIYHWRDKFGRDNLVRRWLGEGFIYDLEAAQRLFDDLVNLDWIKALEGRKYVIHPMVLAFLRCKLLEDNFVTCFGFGSHIKSQHSRGIRRLCLQQGQSLLYSQIELDITDTRSLYVFHGANAVPFERFKRLHVLDIQDTDDLSDTHLESICEQLWRLRYLCVKKTPISQLPQEIGGLKRLETLDASHTKISQLPSAIGNLHHLETLDVSHTQLSCLPQEIGKLEHLETLNVAYTMVNKFPPEIINLQNLKFLDAGHTKVSQLPPEISMFQYLKALNASHTKVNKVPGEIGQLRHLETLDASHTEISEVPSEIGNLHHLETLDVSYSKVCKLPSEIGELHNLQTLNVSYTEVGKVPPGVGKLKQLKTLDVSHTRVRELPWHVFEISQSMSVFAGDWNSRKVVRMPMGIAGDWNSEKVVRMPMGIKQDHIPARSLEKCRELLSIVVFDPFLVGIVPAHVAVFKVSGTHMHIPVLIMRNFKAVSSLDIRLCKLDSDGDDIKFLREMPNLETLVLRLEVLPRKPIAINGEGFAKLESLCVDCRLPRVTFQQDAMPRLKLLMFKFYAGLASHDPVGITHLRSLEKVLFRCSPWYRSDGPGITATIAVVRREAMGHHRRITICINDDEQEVYPEKVASMIYQDDTGAGNGGTSRAGTSEIEEVQERL